MRPPSTPGCHPGRRTRRRTRTVRPILVDERGIALVLTLLVVALLSAMIIEFDYRTRLDLRAASNFRDAARAQLLAESGIEVVRGVLQWDLEHSASYDGEDEMWAQFNGQSIPVPSVLDAVVKFDVSDEGGKLDLNSLLSQTGEDDEARVRIYRTLVEQVLAGEEIEDSDRYDAGELVDSLLDWLDDDPHARPSGAETTDYARLDPPYACGDGPLRTIDELRLVNGYTPELVDRLRRHVTAIWTGGKNTRSFQAGAEPGKINLNTASPELLASLHPQLNEDDARDLWAYIHPSEPHPVEDTSWQGLLSFHNAFSVEQTAQDLAKVLQPRSDVFSAHVTVEIMGEGGLGQPEVRIRRSVEALLQRKPSVGGRRVQVLSWRSQ